MKTTITKRFYTGSKDMAQTYIRNGEVPGNMMILADAIEKAKKMVENGEAEAIFVVEVVRIIRTSPKPVIVETVRK